MFIVERGKGELYIREFITSSKSKIQQTILLFIKRLCEKLRNPSPRAYLESKLYRTFSSSSTERLFEERHNSLYEKMYKFSCRKSFNCEKEVLNCT
jgi:hypothetical protein